MKLNSDFIGEAEDLSTYQFKRLVPSAESTISPSAVSSAESTTTPSAVPSAESTTTPSAVSSAESTTVQSILPITIPTTTAVPATQQPVVASAVVAPIHDLSKYIRKSPDYAASLGVGDKLDYRCNALPNVPKISEILDIKEVKGEIWITMGYGDVLHNNHLVSKISPDGGKSPFQMIEDFQIPSLNHEPNDSTKKRKREISSVATSTSITVHKTKQKSKRCEQLIMEASPCNGIISIFINIAM